LWRSFQIGKAVLVPGMMLQALLDNAAGMCICILGLALLSLFALSFVQAAAERKVRALV
jgi:hypothetical protein